MADENLYDRGYKVTEPFDPNDPPKFGQLVETTKDTFVTELTNYFDYQTANAAEKLTETPTIQKFALGAGTGEQTLQEVVNLIMSHADTEDKYPMIAVTSASFRERKLGIGSALVMPVQYPPSIVSTEKGPFNLTDGWTLEIKTWPTGFSEPEVTSTITFASALFADITNVTVEELVSAINRSQALYYQFSVTADGYLRISTGGPCAVPTPNYIEVTGGDADCLLALGFTVGQSDTYLNTSNPPKNRYMSAGDLTVNIDVVTDDINVRTELCDLVQHFFTFWIERRRYQFIGRSYRDRSIDPEEWWHIVLQSQFNWSGELATPRQGGTEQYDYVFANRGSVPVLSTDAVDRKVVTPPVFLDRDKIVEDEAGVIPAGDYFQTDWTKYPGS